MAVTMGLSSQALKLGHVSAQAGGGVAAAFGITVGRSTLNSHVVRGWEHRRLAAIGIWRAMDSGTLQRVQDWGGAAMAGTAHSATFTAACQASPSDSKSPVTW